MDPARPIPQQREAERQRNGELRLMSELVMSADEGGIAFDQLLMRETAVLHCTGQLLGFGCIIDGHGPAVSLQG